jgi:hypothetical protein
LNRCISGRTYMFMVVFDESSGRGGGMETMEVVFRFACAMSISLYLAPA